MATMGIVLVACCAARGRQPAGKNHVHRQTYQFSGQRRQALYLTLGPACLDDHTLAIFIAQFVELLPKYLDERGRATPALR